MLDRANEIISRYNKLTDELTLPSTIQDNNKYRQLSKEEGELKLAYSLSTKLVALDSDLKAAKDMILNTQDKNEKEYLFTESEQIQGEINELETQLKFETEEKDPNDSRNIILEFRPGAGGDEASLFAGDLMRMYLRFFELKGWKAEQYSISHVEGGGIKEAIFNVQGTNIYGAMKFESGVHRVQRVPVTESSGRIHTSTASVVVLPEVEEVEQVINQEDIRIDVFRAGGPGGQSVNTTDSAVRITHIPTGIVVSCQDEKSQLKNKHRAMVVLKSRLYDLELQKKQNSDSELRNSAIKGGDRSAKIRTYNFPQNRVTDHRIKVSWHNIDSIMNGNLQEIIDTVKANINNPSILGQEDDDD